MTVTHVHIKRNVRTRHQFHDVAVVMKSLISVPRVKLRVVATVATAKIKGMHNVKSDLVSYA